MNLAATFARTAILTALGLVVAGCADNLDPEETLGDEATEEAESELVNGTTTTDYAPVVRIQNSSGELCTATAIADDMLITSAHCVKNGTTVRDWVKVAVAHGANSSAAGVYSSYFFMSEDIYDNTNVGSSNTISYVQKDFVFIKFGAGTFSSYYDTGSVSSSITGQTVRLVAFGGDATKEWGDKTISYTSSGSDYRYITTSRSSGSYLEPGDSGGPVLMASGSTYVVIGVNYGNDGTYNYHPVITANLDSYLMPIFSDKLPQFCVEMFQDINYGGFSWSICNNVSITYGLDDTTFSDPYKIASRGYFDSWNDQLSSLQLPTGMGTVISLYQNSDLSGSSVTFQNHYPFGNGVDVTNLVNEGFNDKYSSMSMTSGGVGSSFNDWMLEITRYGKCVDVNYNGTANGTKIQQYDCSSNNAAQEFKLNAVGSYYQIVHTSSGKCLDVDAGGTANGTKIQLWECDTSNTNQLFSMASNGSTSSVRDFKITHPVSGKCFDLSGGSSSNGTQIQLWTCDSGNTNQNFALKRL